jgi:membrane protease YdiL (CAAX protease family)
MITFSITWGLAGLLLLLREQIESLMGPVSTTHPLFFVAVYGPAIAALTTIAIFDGRAALAAYIRRVVRWRDGLAWYVPVIVAWPLILILCHVMSGTEIRNPATQAGLAALLSAGLAQLILDPGPMEEIGWRGYALPLLQARYTALTASVLLGAVWGVWHLPAFFVSGLSQGGYVFAGFVVGSMAVSVLMTSLYNATRGCIPLMYIFHWSLNDPFDFGKMTVQGALFAVGVISALVAVMALGWRRLGHAKFTQPVPVAAGGGNEW